MITLFVVDDQMLVGLLKSLKKHSFKKLIKYNILKFGEN